MTVTAADKLHKFLANEYDNTHLPSVGDVNAPIPSDSYRISIISMIQRFLETKAAGQTNIVCLLTVVLQTVIRFEKLCVTDYKSSDRLNIEAFRKEQSDILFELVTMFPREFTLAARLVTQYAEPGLIHAPVSA